MRIRLLQTSLTVWVLLAGLAVADEPSPGGRADKPAEAAEASGQTPSLPAKRLSRKKTEGEKSGKQPKKAPGKKGGHKESTPLAGAEREEAVFAFVREHQPDLVGLLERLKATKAKEYERAMTELARESNRLHGLRDRDFDRYQLELRIWQVNSRIRLLTAKLSLEDRPELREEVKAALGEHAEMRMALKKLERQRLTARLKKIEADIAHLAGQGEADLDRKFDRLMRAAERARGRAKPRPTTPIAKKSAATKRAEALNRAEPNPVETEPLKKNEP